MAAQTLSPSPALASLPHHLPKSSSHCSSPAHSTARQPRFTASSGLASCVEPATHYAASLYRFLICQIKITIVAVPKVVKDIK